jgi:small conductance mechanosensitive channel
MYLFLNFKHIQDVVLFGFEEFLPRLVGALLLWGIGTLFIKWLYRVFKRILEAKDFDPTLETFFLSFVKFGLRIALFVAVVGVLGVQSTSFAALLAGVGLALGTAFNGSLGNFAGGVMLIIYQPIRVGEFIEFQQVSGEVVSIGILNTCILTGDRKMVYLPNGILSTGIIINCSRSGMLRVDILFTLDASVAIEVAKKVGLAAIADHPLILSEPKPEAYAHQLQAGSYMLHIRPFTQQKNYSKVFQDAQVLVLEAYKKHNIALGEPK